METQTGFQMSDGAGDGRLRESDHPEKVLTPAPQRALAEAAERRKAAEAAATVEEQGGPAGAEPTRYGDWERKGLAVDF